MRRGKVCSYYSLGLVLSLFNLLQCQIPNPFPIPAFKKSTQDTLDARKYDSSDRTYMVHVLATLLLTHVESPSKKDCGIVAKSLVLKYPFLKLHVRVDIELFPVGNFIVITFRKLGRNFYIPVVTMSTEKPKERHLELLGLRNVRLTLINMFIRH